MDFVLDEVLGSVSGFSDPASNFIDDLSRVFDPIFDEVLGLACRVLSAFDDIVDGIDGLVDRPAGGSAGSVKEFLDEIACIGLWYCGGGGVLDDVRDRVDGRLNLLSRIVDGVASRVADIFSSLSDCSSGIFCGAADAIANPVGGIQCRGAEIFQGPLCTVQCRVRSAARVVEGLLDRPARV